MGVIMKLKKNGHKDNGITGQGLSFICSPSGILSVTRYKNVLNIIEINYPNLKELHTRTQQQTTYNNHNTWSVISDIAPA